MKKMKTKREEKMLISSFPFHIHPTSFLLVNNTFVYRLLFSFYRHGPSYSEGEDSTQGRVTLNERTGTSSVGGNGCYVV